KKKKHVLPPTSESEDDVNESSSSSDSEEEQKPKKKSVKQEVCTKVVERSPAKSIDDLAHQLRALNLAGISPFLANTIANLPKELPNATMAATPAMAMAPYPNPSYQAPAYPSPSYLHALYANPSFSPQTFGQFPHQQFPGPLNLNAYQSTQGPPVTFPNSIPVQGNGYGGPPRNGQHGRGPPNGPLPPHVLCFFCKENHLLRNCTYLPGYIQSNHVVQMGRWFYWPDGHPQARQVIQADPNTGVKGVLDRPAVPPQQPAVETVEADLAEESGGSKVEEVVGDEADKEQLGDVQGVDEVVKEKCRCVEIDEEVKNEEDELVWLEGFKLERIEEAEMMVTTRAAGKKKKDEVDSVKSDDEAKVGGQVPEVTVRDLTALSPALRRTWIEYTKTQRVPTSSTMQGDTGRKCKELVNNADHGPKAGSPG
ncbi:hypothetical protein EV360DRAFT_77171, partial [Lentinula raphanica]